MKRYALITVLVMLTLLLWQDGRMQRAKIKPLESQVSSLKGERDAAVRTAEGYSKIIAANAALAKARKSESLVAQKEVIHAVKNNPEWSDTPVPDSIWDALAKGSPRPSGD